MSPSPASFQSILVTDFDGTMTEKDFYQLALERFTPPGTRLVWEQYKRRELTPFQALQYIFSTIQATSADLIAALADLQFDTSAKGAIERLRANGWEVIIVSVGCDWYIKRILQQAGITATLHANPGVFHEGGGLEMRAPTESPFQSKFAGIDKAAVVREAQSEYSRVAFAGNSAPDLEAARLVADDLRFARTQLAELLDREQRPYRRFSSWGEIAEMLLGS